MWEPGSYPTKCGPARSEATVSGREITASQSVRTWMGCCKSEMLYNILGVVQTYTAVYCAGSAFCNSPFLYKNKVTVQTGSSSCPDLTGQEASEIPPM